jgi:hypothetical protein
MFPIVPEPGKSLEPAANARSAKRAAVECEPADRGAFASCLAEASRGSEQLIKPERIVNSFTEQHVEGKTEEQDGEFVFFNIVEPVLSQNMKPVLSQNTESVFSQNTACELFQTLEPDLFKTLEVDLFKTLEVGFFETSEPTASFKVFSESMQDLLAFLKDALEAKGLGADEFSKRMEKFLGKDWQDTAKWDIPRLLEMSSKLGLQRQLYDLAKTGGDPGCLNINMDLVLTKLENGLEAQPKDDGSDTADSPQALVASRIHVYLKGVPRKTENGLGEPEKNKAEERDKEEKTLFPELKDAAVLTVPVPPVVEAGKVPEGTREVQDAGVQRDSLAARFSPELKGDAPLAGGAAAGSGQPKASVSEHGVDFDRFFQGVIDAPSNVRVSAEAPVQRLDLGKGVHLPRNEALREGLDNTVRFIRASGVQKAEVIVDPPALGRVSVELTSTTTGLEAAIKVSSEQVRQLVQDQLMQLRFTLAQQGVELTHFSVDVQQDGGQRQHEQQGAEQNGNGVLAGDDDGTDEETVFRVDLNEGLLYWVA